jgi:membrane protease YdiL (CAAX protease family)
VDVDQAAAPEAPSPRPLIERPTLLERVVALLEVIICSDFPTQLALAATFHVLGISELGAGGGLSLRYVVLLSLFDAAFLIALIVFLLRVHGERPRDVFLGARSPEREARVGVPLSFVALGIAIAALASIQRFAPWLHTQEDNPFKDLVRNPADAAALAVVLIVAGGIREEIQRAFLMRRFERWLGGRTVGVVVASVGFGAGHAIQGLDIAVVTGVLGAFWAIVYLRRRSIVAPAVSHSGFNLLQLGQLLIVGR